MTGMFADVRKNQSLVVLCDPQTGKYHRMALFVPSWKLLISLFTVSHVRAVKQVSQLSKYVCGWERKDGFVWTRIANWEVMPALRSKKNLNNVSSPCWETSYATLHFYYFSLCNFNFAIRCNHLIVWSFYEDWPV